MRLNTIIYILLQWTWGIIQNILGLIIFLSNITRKHYCYKGSVVTLWNSEEKSTSIGMFIFMSENCPKDKKRSLSRQETFERTLVHEYGHTIQSIILGPLFLLIIGIPSSLWALTPILKKYRINNKISYFSFYTESWANYLGEKITKSKSMEQAIIDF